MFALKIHIVCVWESKKSDDTIEKDLCDEIKRSDPSETDS